MKNKSENGITLTHIKRNWRYKIFRYKDKTYILDGSTFCFSFILFVTKWLFLPINAYEVSEEVIEELKEEGAAQGLNTNWNIILLIVFVSSIFAKIVGKIVNNLNLGENFNIVYLYM